MTSNTPQIQTEADALRDILSWSQDRSVWQRDALRRIVLEGELSDNDFDELTALCKDSSLPSNEALFQPRTERSAGRGELK